MVFARIDAVRSCVEMAGSSCADSTAFETSCIMAFQSLLDCMVNFV
jgi:hypothetical protein